MTAGASEQTPVGVRAVTGALAGRLTWVTAGAFNVSDLRQGSRVLVRDGASEWFGEVVVLPGRLLESPPLAEVPVMVRPVTEADGWPVAPERAGWALLDALALPAEMLEPAAE